MRMTLGVVLACAALGGICAAHDADAAIKRPTEIPAQALAPALQLLVRERDIQLVYRAELINDHRTSGASGDLTAVEALSQLLNGTGLTYRYLDEKTITILPAASADARVGTPAAAEAAKAPAAGPRTTSSGADAKGAQKTSFWDRFRLAQAAGGASPVAPGSAPEQRPSQGATDAADTPADIQEVQVTGSRLVVEGGFQAPTPVTVVSAEQLSNASPTGLSDSLNQLPVFGNSSTPASNGVSTVGTVGQSFLNLRALGASRTLVLLDGRRVVPSTGNGTTDISVLPEAMVSRVDVVTGGASAAYGSDAVAGVVNFVLDTKFEGVKATVQGGEAEEGDSQVRKVLLSGGTSFLGGRAHIIGSASYYSNSGINAWRDRDWYNSCTRMANPALVPSTIIACGAHSAGFTAGGLIPSGPLKGTQFGEGGVPQPFTYGQLATTLSMIGGGGEDHGRNFSAVPEVERETAFAHLTYDLNDNVSFFLEGLYGRATAHFEPLPAWEGQSTGFTIYNDNAFLPASIKQQMATANITSFPMWRFDYDFGLLIADSRNRTKRGTTGIQATFGGWSLNAYYEHGENNYYQTTQNNPKINLLYNAVDAVVGPNGNVICRSTLANPSNGCVPLNMFGSGSPSQAAKDWLLGTTWGDQLVKQDVVDVSLSGKPLDLWAGPLSVAFGGGYRRESSNQVVDPISSSTRHFTGDYKGWPSALEGLIGGWERTNLQPLSGSYDVTEVFAESLVPLLREAPFARSLDLNLAARYTDYSTSGNVTTWKAGLTYEPISSIRLRGTISRDIRAANITELFSGPSLGQGNLIDPFQAPSSPNRTPVVFTLPQGNPALTPEKADTHTIGVVLQPTFLPGFSASFDFYDITIKDAIGTLSGQVIIDQCFQGATSLCGLLHRDTTGVLVSVDAPYLNLSSRKTRGLDVEMAYRAPVAGGTLDLRGLATYIDTLTTKNPGAPVIESAGQTGILGSGGVPHIVADVSASYRGNGGFGAYLQERYIGKGALDKTLTPAILDPASNRVSAVMYTDLTLTQRIGDRSSQPWSAELFFTVNNLFDRDPPVAASPWFVFGVANGSTNASVFDVIGRQYNAGIRVQF
ncbi:MAG: TonB-dependent receptor [Gammaproteobacteria bacterium]